MEKEQVVAVQKRFNDLGFPRDNDDFKMKVEAAVNKVLETGQPQKIEHERKRSNFEITIGPGKDTSKIYVNEIIVKNTNGDVSLRFPMGNVQPTLKAMENAANAKWILLEGYQPKDKTKTPNDVWFRQKDGKKEFVSAKDFSICKEGHEVLGYKLTSDDVKEMHKGNNVLTNDCLRYEKGSKVPVGKNDKTVALFTDPPGNRIGYNQLQEKLDLKKNSRQNQTNGVDVNKAVDKATKASQAETVETAPKKKNAPRK
jgi:hypothetical protein